MNIKTDTDVGSALPNPMGTTRWVATPGGYVPEGGEATPELPHSLEVTVYGPGKEKYVVKRYYGDGDGDGEAAALEVEATFAALRRVRSE